MVGLLNIPRAMRLSCASGSAGSLLKMLIVPDWLPAVSGEK
ncbi:MAG: hypothetical protein R3C26_17455 [Calditrichia bacterium]